MGEFFNSFHISGAENSVIMAASEKISRESSCKFLVSPQNGRWTAVYPGNTLNQEAVAQSFASQVQADLIHLFLHDGDVFCYHYFHNGRRRDTYCSHPDYFGPVSGLIRKSQRGKPAAFSGLLSDSEQTALAELLAAARSSEPFSAGIGFGKFATLLDLTNTDTSYDYLLADSEGEPPAGFVHIPDLAPARTRQRQRLASLRKNGLLLYGQTPAPSAICPDNEKGFLLTPDRSDPPSPELSRLAPPWSEGRQGIDLPIGQCWRMSLSPSGRYLATPSGLWDLSDHRQIAIFGGSQNSWPDSFHFTVENALLISTPRNTGRELTFVSIPDGATRIVKLAQARQIFALHPSGTTLLTGTGPLNQLCRVDLSALEMKPLILPAGKVPLPGWLGKMQDLLGASSADARPETPSRVQFSTDGILLFCLMNNDVRIFDWQSILDCPDGRPEPRFLIPLRSRSAETESKGFTLESLLDSASFCALAMAEDPIAHRLLVGTTAGEIISIDLATGHKATLLTIPGGLPLRQIELSADNRTLAAVSDPMLKQMNGRKRQLFLFDYAKLRAQSAAG